MKTFEVTQNSRMWLHSQPSPMKIVWQRTLLSTTCVAECLKPRESSKHDKRKSAGAVAGAFGSPSFARTWRQKELRQCPCFEARFGSTKVEVSIGRERRSRRP